MEAISRHSDQPSPTFRVEHADLGLLTRLAQPFPKMCLPVGNEGSFETLYLLSPQPFDPIFPPPVRSTLSPRREPMGFASLRRWHRQGYERGRIAVPRGMILIMLAETSRSSPGSKSARQAKALPA